MPLFFPTLKSKIHGNDRFTGRAFRAALPKGLPQGRAELKKKKKKKTAAEGKKEVGMTPGQHSLEG